ncbi:cold shock domain-containing protein [Ureibacillus acetophenoni]|uniref:Cold-shock-like DNA binding protein n=1 Tax=Ureibacillus acetophenoni TaxID=614649 RepID=A0A285U5U2_9BACL|nr:cold shock domain-containing protein [Ureibacillus acetophenoni]SOC37083.1 cold-shock-like DNA binding protein [Ureibacillus acetophenoni]
MNELLEAFNNGDLLKIQRILAGNVKDLLLDADERVISDILRAVRRAYKDSNNLDFLNAGDYLAQHVLLQVKDNPFINNAYGWILYDLCFSQNLSVAIRMDIYEKVVTITRQGEYSPYEQFIWKLIDLLEKEPSDQKQNILTCLNRLNPDLLDRIPFLTNEGRELASKLEKWFSKQSKLRYELKMYDTCIKASNEFLKKISKFHHDNDSWTKRRIALCLVELNQLKEAKQELQNLLIHFEHSSIYADLMSIAVKQGDLQIAKAYGANAILHRSGELKHKLKVLDTMGEIYEKENEGLAYSHYVLLQTVRKREGWSTNKVVEEKILKYKQKNVSLLEQKALLPYWKNDAYSIFEKATGIIKNLLQNGESGFIITDDGRDVFFSMRNNRQLKRKVLIQGERVTFYMKPTFDRRKNRKSIEAINIFL